MQIHDIHAWDVTPGEAVRLQQELRQKVHLHALPAEIRLVAGADVSYTIGSNRFYAGVVVLQFPELVPVEEIIAVGDLNFPYIPGLLSFREGPILLKAFRMLKSQPDVILFDGQGIAHPKGIGIASHVGLFLKCSSIGCAKSWLTGIYDPEALQTAAGSSVPLYAEDLSVIGAVVRTKQKIRPIFVSPGVGADVPTSVEFVLKCCRGYRLPEPTRLAHHLANRARREEVALIE